MMRMIRKTIITAVRFFHEACKNQCQKRVALFLNPFRLVFILLNIESIISLIDILTN